VPSRQILANSCGKRHYLMRFLWTVATLSQHQMMPNALGEAFTLEKVEVVQTFGRIIVGAGPRPRDRLPGVAQYDFPRLLQFRHSVG
jgi:hypothetical protein